MLPSAFSFRDNGYGCRVCRLDAHDSEMIGRRTGVANIFGVNFSGFIAWWLWRTVYLIKLSRLEKKARVAFDWTLDLFFAKDFACVNTASNRTASAKAQALLTHDPASSPTVSIDEKSGATVK
jgi:alternative NADH:quinone oxidoreductase NDH2-like protein